MRWCCHKSVGFFRSFCVTLCGRALFLHTLTGFPVWQKIVQIVICCMSERETHTMHAITLFVLNILNVINFYNGKAEVSAVIIQSSFSWSFRKHYNMLIWHLKNLTILKTFVLLNVFVEMVMLFMYACVCVCVCVCVKVRVYCNGWA